SNHVGRSVAGIAVEAPRAATEAFHTPRPERSYRESLMPAKRRESGAQAIWVRLLQKCRSHRRLHGSREFPPRYAAGRVADRCESLPQIDSEGRDLSPEPSR